MIESLILDRWELDPREGTVLRPTIWDPEGEEMRIEAETRTIDMMEKVPACSPDGEAFQVRAPAEPGVYRIYLWATDPAGNVGAASVTFRVKGSVSGPPMAGVEGDADR